MSSEHFIAGKDASLEASINAMQARLTSDADERTEHVTERHSDPDPCLAPACDEDQIADAGNATHPEGENGDHHRSFGISSPAERAENDL